MARMTSLLAVLLIVLLAGCSGGNGQNPASSTNAANGTRAHAVLASASSSHVSGKLAFVSTDHGVHITGRISGLKPNSTHGFHIHANGDCGAPDASSAGGHFNPTQQPHGHPESAPHHAGDIPNQQANADGVATVDVVAKGIELGTGSDNDVLGRAIIVHAQADDYTSQPSGASGARVACGVITRD